MIVVYLERSGTVEERHDVPDLRALSNLCREKEWHLTAAPLPNNATIFIVWWKDMVIGNVVEEEV